MEQLKELVAQLSSQMGIRTMESSDDYRELYPHIELTELETEIALANARMSKFFILEDKRRREKQEAFAREMERPFTAEEFFALIGTRLVQDYGFSANEGIDGKPVYVMDEDNKFIIEWLTYYFTNDPRFEKGLGKDNGWKLNKGLLLMGGVGRGKTLLMNLMARNKRQSFVVVSCRTVGDTYAKDGPDALEFYSSIRREAYGDPRVYYQRDIGYCFDDLGTEEVKNNYGNKVNVMADILLNRYDKKFEMPLCQTHLTTNLSADEIEQHYGTRVRSRLREMFNVITLPGKDKRC